jgi:hypothetical protein
MLVATRYATNGLGRGLAVAAVLATGVPAGAQEPGAWSYRAATGKAEVGALSGAGTYVGGTLLDAACAYDVRTLDPAAGAQGAFACGAGGVTATSLASSEPGAALRARAEVTSLGRPLEPGLTAGISSFAVATQAVQITVAPIGAAPATLAFFVDVDGVLAIDGTGGPTGLGFGQALLSMGYNAVPSYTGATFARVSFVTTRTSPTTSGEASFAGTADPAIAGRTGTQRVAGRAQFLLPTAVGENYYALDLSTFAFVFNPGGAPAPVYASASVDFARSARIVGLQALDAAGNDVTAQTGLTIVGEAIPLGAPAVVPEPAVVVLLGSGLLVLGVAARRRRPGPGAA